VYRPSIEAGRATLGDPDFAVLLKYGYVATADLPVAFYFERILRDFPGCKFILTTRASSEIWFSSWEGLIDAITKPTRFFRFMSHARQLNEYYRWLFAIVNQNDAYLTKNLDEISEQDRDRAIASYERHNQLVRSTIPAEKLLEYHVKEGWDPLCRFLDIDANNCPNDTSFPKTNSMRTVLVQTLSAMIIPLVLSIGLVVLLLVQCCRYRNKAVTNKRKTS